MTEKRLTADQVHALEGYERFFRQATEAAWCSYPGQAGINLMLDVWTSLTGSAYPYKPGCPNCLMNLVRDMGTIYFSQKDSVLAAETPAKADSATVETASTTVRAATKAKGRASKNGSKRK